MKFPSLFPFLTTIAIFVPITFSVSNPKSKAELTKSLLNYCIDSENHKSTPGPEDDLHHQVYLYKQFSQFQQYYHSLQ